MLYLLPIAVGFAIAGTDKTAQDISTAKIADVGEIWSDAQHEALERGEPVFESWQDNDGRIWGLSRIRVEAPKDVVWKLILNVDDYVRFLPYVTSSSVDGRTKDGECERIDAEFAITTLRITTQYRQTIEHCPNEDTAKFWFEQGRINAIEGAVGWWRVIEGNEALEIEYAIAAETYWWVPDKLEEKAATLGLPRIVREIRDEAQKTAK